MLDDIKVFLGEMYYKHGLTDETLSLSQFVDELINKYNEENIAYEWVQ